MSRGSLLSAVLFLALVVAPLPASAHGTKADARLPVIGEAPEFTLTDQDGASLALRDLRGKVVAVTFIYATCTDTCPLLTAKLVSLQKPLGPAFGSRIRFVAITVDPAVDTPTVLRAYAKAHAADPAGWSFLTGAPARVQEVVRSYGGFAKKTEQGGVDHLFLTSLIDRQGRLRVQYLGYRFKPDELLQDLQALLRE